MSETLGSIVSALIGPRTLFVLSGDAGEFLFRADGGANAKTITRQAEWKWPTQQRLWGHATAQFVGVGVETLEIEAEVLPLWRGTGTGEPEKLRKIAASVFGQAEPTPFILTTGTGDVLGEWTIISVEETQDVVGPGGAPLSQKVRLRLQRYAKDTGGVDDALSHEEW